MTGTRRWLQTKRKELLLRQMLGSIAFVFGVLLATLAIGLLVGTLGTYRHAPVLIVGAWLLPLAVLGGGTFYLYRCARSFGVMSLAETVERGGGRRKGSVAGVAAYAATAGSASLASLADRQALSWLAEEGDRSLARTRRGAARRMAAGFSTLVVGGVLFAAVGPAGPGSMFWRPLAVLASSRGPVSLDVDRTTVERGDSVTVIVTARGRASAALWVRAPGEPWDQRPLALDSVGAATVVLGPLDSDRFLRAVSGGRSSETVRVAVALPALITELDLLARYPRYLDLPDEPLGVGADTILLPRGTEVRTRGWATVLLSSASWSTADRAVALETDGTAFSGSFTVRRSGHWHLAVETESGGGLSQEAPELVIVAVRDSAPMVTVPVPGSDTTAPVSLQQALLVDARDDHRLTAVEVVSWRVSRTGTRSEPVVETIPLPEDGAERAILHWILDLNDRGFLPGDTAFFQARARDNAPAPHETASQIYRLRLLAMAELRQAMREESQSVSEGADSLVGRQENLAQRLEDLAAEQERSAMTEPDQVSFESAERARELLDEEQRMAERADSLREQVRELADAAWEAGITDPAFHEQLSEIQELLRRAITEELLERLDALRNALDRLDASDVRDALRQLADEARQLQEEFARGRDLFERAAIEGELTTLSSDAEELARRQDEWNQNLETVSDSAARRAEEELAARADSLAAQLDRLGESLDSAGMSPEGVSEGQDAAAAAAGAMRQAAAAAGQGERSDAQQSGEEAAEALDPLAADLRQERDRLREEWRQEVLAQLDRALVETAELAKAQQGLGEQLAHGESGPDVRGQQAAVKEGVDRVVERLRSAAGKNALVSPQLGMALGMAKLRMEETIEELQQAAPNTRNAGESSGESLDALNQVVYAMVQSRGQVSGAESGSGLAEALEQMAQLAEQQGQLTGESGGLLPMMQAGGDQLMQELQALAAQQRALAQQLERMRAQGELTGMGELAEEAEQIARDLEEGRLDRETVERQERLFRRLLDAGRTLESDEEDEQTERVAESARPGNVRLPGQLDVPAGTPRYRYPDWDELRSLSPEERRLILDYFRRLNRVRP
jgi:hypothetical protein